MHIACMPVTIYILEFKRDSDRDVYYNCICIEKRKSTTLFQLLRTRNQVLFFPLFQKITEILLVLQKCSMGR